MRTVAALLLAAPAAVAAQDYRFEVPELLCNLSLEEDASLLVYYEITFRCSPGADPIDIVDIGLPTAEYDLESVAAELDGVVLDGIRRSSYIDIGVEIPLGSNEIQPGETSVLKVSATNPHMAFRDDVDSLYASTEFSPTWFDFSLLDGPTEVVIRFMFPPGADPNTVRHHELPFTDSWVTTDGRVVYEWRTTRIMSSSYFIGVSYPAALISGEIRDHYDPWAGMHATGRGFRISEGLCMGVCFGVTPLAVIALIVLGVRSSWKRRLRYMPPRIGVEGVGMKRGLTAPQAALLLELRLEKVTGLILYGLVLKEAVELSIVNGRPVLARRSPPPEGLHAYEKDFLEAVNDGRAGGDALDDARLGKTLTSMVVDLQERMKGFSAKETREYYRSIISEAWETAAKAGATGAAADILGEQLSWMMMDDGFDSRLRSVSADPVWMRPVTFSGGAGRLAGGQGAISIVDFCGRIASSIEGAAGGLVGSFTSLTTRVTAVTNPIPVSTSRGTGSGGRSSCACACACACAGCACACAGGGR